MIELVLMKCDQYEDLVGSTNRNIITNHPSLHEFELKMSALIGSSPNESQCDEDTDVSDEKKQFEICNAAQDMRNPVKMFMKNLSSDEERKV